MNALLLALGLALLIGAPLTVRMKYKFDVLGRGNTIRYGVLTAFAGTALGTYLTLVAVGGHNLGIPLVGIAGYIPAFRFQHDTFGGFGPSGKFNTGWWVWTALVTIGTVMVVRHYALGI